MSFAKILIEHPEVAEIDRHFAAFVGRFGNGELPRVAAAMVSRNIRHGHICLDLAAGPAPFDQPPGDLHWPALEAWREGLAANRAVGGPQEQRPLVLEQNGRLYLRRYWQYETSLAEQILRRCPSTAETFPQAQDDQDTAVGMACTRRFAIISGGPGTGKTTTILRIIERLRGLPGGDQLRIKLAAPTGKAAARLQEAVRAGKAACKEELEGFTLHRLLGFRSGSVSFRHGAGNPLPCDVLVIDEASMVPLPLMAKTFAALPPQARVILVGDRDQLSSVEPGAVLGDVAEAASGGRGPVAGSLTILRKNYRFSATSRIARLCAAVRGAEVDLALEILGAGGGTEVRSRTLPDRSGLGEALRERVIAGFSPYLAETDPGEALRRFQTFRVLCALRAGPFGVENLNRVIEQLLRDADLLSGPSGACPRLPILITRNDYDLRLFNGDIGILHEASGRLVAGFFDENDNLRVIPPARLPEHEPAFAMTVHKSQGSEFDDVLLLLSDRDSPVLTRELVYTGLTRARRSVELWYQDAILRAAIARKLPRTSGLRDRLEEPGSSGRGKPRRQLPR